MLYNEDFFVSRNKWQINYQKLTCKIKATRSDDRALTPLGTRRCAAIAAVDTFLAVVTVLIPWQASFFYNSLWPLVGVRLHPLIIFDITCVERTMKTWSSDNAFKQCWFPIAIRWCTVCIRVVRISCAVAIEQNFPHILKCKLKSFII